MAARKALAFTVAMAIAGVGTAIAPARADGTLRLGEPTRMELLRYDDAAVAEPPAPGNGNGLLIAGLGAITGVVAFNLATGGTAALPFLAGTGTGTISAAEGAVAVSRVYAVTSAVAGALAADWFYRNSQEQKIRPVPRRLAARLAL